MNIKTASYVSATDLFRECGKAWVAFTESDPDFTWGDNRHSLVSKDEVEEILEGEKENTNEIAVLGQINAVLRLIEDLPQWTCIDLES